jgi:hypothetical protein
MFRVDGIMAGPKDALARTFRLPCATCGGVFRRDRFASGKYRWRFPEDGDGAEAAPGIPAAAPSPACRDHEADALCRYHVALRTAERWAAAAAHFPPGAEGAFVTVQLTPFVRPLGRIAELRPAAMLAYAHEALRRGFGRLAPEELAAVRLLGHLDVGLAVDERCPEPERVTHVVPHVHGLAGGVPRGRLARALRGATPATELVPYPTHAAATRHWAGRLQYARKHVDDLRLRVLRAADDGSVRSHKTAPDERQRSAVREWTARFRIRDFELVMGLQRKGVALVAYPMRPRKAGR